MTMRFCAFALGVLLLVPRPVRAQGGNPLGPEFRVNTYTTNGQGGGSVAADASGNFIVVWASYHDGSGGGIFGQRYASSGSPLGSEFRVNTYTTGYQNGGVVAADSAGNFVVVWQDYGQDGDSYGIFGQRYTSSGAPLGSEFRVNSFTTSSQGDPAVAADPSGNFVVVWTSYQDGSANGVFGQRYASSGVPLGPEFRMNTYTTDEQGSPAISTDAAGNFVVVWGSYYQGGVGSRGGGSNPGIFGQRYSSGGVPLGPEFRVNTYTTGGQYDGSVASAASGDFVVVWNSVSQDGSDYGVFGQRFASSGGALGPEFRANTYTTGSQRSGFVAASSAGDFVVAWDSYGQDGSYTGLLGQRYAAAGPLLGTEFRINTYTTNRQTRPILAADPAGDFVVVWQSNVEDGSQYGVFGQRYGPILPVELMRFGVE